MASTFSGLEIARSGLVISQIGLNITGQNIANADTQGYTRQRVVATAADPSSVIGKTKLLAHNNVGRGVTIKVLDQIRNGFLDKQYRSQNSNYSYWSKRTEGLTYLESYFDDVQEETSVNYSIASFFDAVKKLGEDSVEGAQRKLLQESGSYLAAHLNDVYSSLIEIQETQNFAVETTVNSINTIATSIIDLNKSIHAFETTGLVANDLRDKRNLLLDELSAICDIEYSEMGGFLTVSIGGETLINHTDQNFLGTRTQGNVIEGENDVLIPCWVDENGTTIKDLNVKGGELQAYIDMRDSTDTQTPGIPFFIEMLNNLARAIVQEVNAVHSQGYTYPTGTAGGSQTNVNFFEIKKPVLDIDGKPVLDAQGNPTYTYEYNAGDLKSVTAKNIVLSRAVTESEFNIACSSKGIVTQGNPEELQAGNNENMKKLYNIFNSKTIGINVDGANVDIGSLDSYTTSIRFNVAATLKNSKSTAENRNSMLLSAENQRLSVSGVSLDEEMTNLIKYQHAYSGASRVISAMDEMLEKLINGTGRVGL